MGTKKNKNTIGGKTRNHKHKCKSSSKFAKKRHADARIEIEKAIKNNDKLPIALNTRHRKKFMESSAKGQFLSADVLSFYRNSPLFLDLHKK